MNVSFLKFLLLFLCFYLFGFAQLQSQPPKKRTSREEYIEQYKNDAIRDMVKTGVPASITLAQGLLESDDGNSELAINANNHFGIKCHKEWAGPTYIMDDDQRNECFRKYSSVLDSYDDHSDFLRTRSRYAFLFDLPRTDYVAWAKGLKKAGYATNPKYPEMLIKIIEENKLHELDKQDKIKVFPSLKHKITRDVTPTHNLPSSQNIMVSSNRIKYIIAREGDTYLKIAKRHEMGLWQIYKYNELDKSMPLKAGQLIYLQPKRRKASVHYHTVKPGESMHTISQIYGVKMKHLYRKNRMSYGMQVQPGQKLWLRKKKPRID
jgi:LysM repeat protein